MSNCFSKLKVGRGSWIHNTFLQRKCTPDLNLYFGMAIEFVPRGHKEVYTINNSKIKIPVDMQYHPKYQGKFNISVSNNYFILKIPV
jgi:hypothetical protein